MITSKAIKSLLDWDPSIKGTKVWDPACGAGLWAEALAANGCQVTASDGQATGRGPKRDFLVDRWAYPQVDWIITQPPWAAAHGFITQSQAYRAKAAQRGQGLGVALLLTATYWQEEAGGRLFRQAAPSAVLPLMGQGDGAGRAWCVWFPEGRGEYTIFEPLCIEPSCIEPSCQPESLR